MLRQILAGGIVPAEEPEEEEAVDRTEPERRSWPDLLLPAGLLLLCLILTDIAVRRLRWKDVLMAFGRAG